MSMQNFFRIHLKRYLSIRHLREISCSKFLRIHEDFVLNPDDILKKMCDYYEIEFDPDYKNNFFNLVMNYELLIFETLSPHLPPLESL